eukprot:5108601-Heterocapsa_arctica.AAC.1
MALKVFEVCSRFSKVFEGSLGILAITIILFAKRLSFCTTSELDTHFERQQHARSIIACCSMPIYLLCNAPLSCTPVRLYTCMAALDIHTFVT